jgi:hypothetical protein
VGFLGRLKKGTDKGPKIEYTSGEYMENMEGAYVHGGFGPEEEASAKEIQRVLSSDRVPMTKATAAERLAKLEELRNNRIITEAEFERIRQEIRKDVKAEQGEM